MPDFILILVSPFLSLLMRVSYSDFNHLLPELIKLLPLIVLIRITTYIIFDAHKMVWRYVGVADAIRLMKAVISSSLILLFHAFLFEKDMIPVSTYVIDAAILFLLMAGMRVARRTLYEYNNKKELKSHGQRTLIYGAGSTGQGILKRLVTDQNLNLLMTGFIDDSPFKVGKIIAGYRVHGDQKNLAQIIQNLEVRQVVVGIANPSPQLLKEIIQICSEYGVRPLMMASADLQKSTLRAVDFKDLLVREAHQMNLDSTRKMVNGKRILITGGGGSIGSEIVRQTLDYGPSQLVILDHAEFNLYLIDSELSSHQNYKSIVPKLLDLKDSESLDLVFKDFRPEIILHAAAYKHVHLVEANPYTAILNNIGGTHHLLSLAEKYQVENFVLVSTDKAVNPVGVMGATKRICEIMTSIKGFKAKKNYCSVRFGNVLGSSGSLIPKLKKQILNSEPITITHPEMTRYFMLIEEAVSLVLKAASIASPGDINVLRMGEPIKIVDIAKTLIQLMGKTESEVRIEYTGLRPGEKMFEELYISGKELNTEHPDILVVPRGDHISDAESFDQVEKQIELMLEKAHKNDSEAIQILNRLVGSKYNLQQATELGS